MSSPRLARPREVPALTREATPEEKRLVVRLPKSIVADLNHHLDRHQKRKGPGRVIVVYLALEDETGLVGTLGTYVLPAKEWAQPESA